MVGAAASAEADSADCGGAESGDTVSAGRAPGGTGSAGVPGGAAVDGPDSGASGSAGERAGAGAAGGAAAAGAGEKRDDAGWPLPVATGPPERGPVPEILESGSVCASGSSLRPSTDGGRYSRRSSAGGGGAPFAPGARRGRGTADRGAAPSGPPAAIPGSVACPRSGMPPGSRATAAPAAALRSRSAASPCRASPCSAGVPGHGASRSHGGAFAGLAPMPESRLPPVRSSRPAAVPFAGLAPLIFPEAGPMFPRPAALPLAGIAALLPGASTARTACTVPGLPWESRSPAPPCSWASRHRSASSRSSSLAIAVSTRCRRSSEMTPRSTRTGGLGEPDAPGTRRGSGATPLSSTMRPPPGGQRTNGTCLDSGTYIARLIQPKSHIVAMKLPKVHTSHRYVTGRIAE